MLRVAHEGADPRWPRVVGGGGQDRAAPRRPLSWLRTEEDGAMKSHDQVLSDKDDRPRGALVGRRSLAFTRVAAVLITVGIGAASFVLSFAALRDLASRAGIPGQLAWLWPMIVDGTILQAT